MVLLNRASWHALCDDGAEEQLLAKLRLVAEAQGCNASWPQVQALVGAALSWAAVEPQLCLRACCMRTLVQASPLSYFKGGSLVPSVYGCTAEGEAWFAACVAWSLYAFGILQQGGQATAELALICAAAALCTSKRATSFGELAVTTVHACLGRRRLHP